VAYLRPKKIRLIDKATNLQLLPLASQTEPVVAKVISDSDDIKEELPRDIVNVSIHSSRGWCQIVGRLHLFVDSSLPTSFIHSFVHSFLGSAQLALSVHIHSIRDCCSRRWKVKDECFSVTLVDVDDTITNQRR